MLGIITTVELLYNSSYIIMFLVSSYRTPIDILCRVPMELLSNSCRAPAEHLKSSPRPPLELL
jgi:hypothetical protein